GFGGGMGGIGQPSGVAATPRYSIPSQQLEDQAGNEAKLGLLEKSLEQSRETRRSLSDESRQRVAGRAGVARGGVPTTPMRGESLNAPITSNRGQQAQQQGQIDQDSDGIVESLNGANLDDLFTNVDKQLPQSGAVSIDALNLYFANGATDKASGIGGASGRPGEVAKAKKDQAVTGEQLQRETSKGKRLGMEGESLFEREFEADEFALGSTVQGRSDSKESKDARFGKPNDAVTWQFRQEKIEEVFKELNAQQEPFSTFSLHVSDVSFKLARDAFAKGQWPDATRVRIEEFVNAIDYGDPMPTQRERIACQIEQTIHPALLQRNLVRIAMRTAATGRSSSTPLRLTFLLDHSGSMERSDRRRTVQRVFQVLAGQLQQQDQVTLISFSSQPRLIADRLPGLQAAEVLSLIEQLPSEGGTNLEEALRLAGEKAREQFTEGAQNRIILVTDGAVNLGNANPSSLKQMVLSMRDSGIAFDAAGVAADGLNDEILEALTRQGDGRYYLLDSQESVEDGFAKQIAGALRPAAKNVKVQVEFNSQRVGMYKLLGFEKHRLKTEDFRNDSVDAAEMAAAEAGVAVYQVQVKPDGVGDIGTVAIRFQDLSSGRMVEERWPITYDASTLRLERSTVSMKLAGVASLFAMKLKGDERASTIDLGYLREVMNTLPSEKLEAAQVNDLKQMLDQAWQMGEVPPLP
ncbi:MAG: von Willebrand factor type A domain-containing protein, partial [Rubripirellula sp.]|nr:von Willebrand factor type A domain-containing protein [Rubripirellula sp.]